VAEKNTPAEPRSEPEVAKNSWRADTETFCLPNVL
jgi:hypothetical protein